jgi:hypothetical protein
MSYSAYTPGPIAAAGAFTADFGLPGGLPLEQLPEVIEHDRVIMETRSGMRQKHLPFRLDTATGTVLSGGRYLFDTFAHAQAYKDWAERELIVDGVPFFQRPLFINPVILTWQVLGAHDFQPVPIGHSCIRFERWAVEEDRASAQLSASWPALQATAERQGVASVWLLHNPEQRQLGLVTVTGQRLSSAGDISQPPTEARQSLGALFEERGGVRKVFDRTSWVLTIWVPRRDSPKAGALWPNSPPFPQPKGAR